MAIDIEKLSESELLELNQRIVARLKIMRALRTQASMLEFSIGERVSFQPESHPEIFGIISKYNRKSVTVITETGQQWNVAPVHLRKVVVPTLATPVSGQVIALPLK
jgi:hypothetical protein